jgi:SNF2 family DNA or RNA helicase
MELNLLNNGFLVAVTSNFGSDFLALSNMPGRKRWQGRTLIFQPSGINIQYVIERWPDAHWDESAIKVCDSYLQLKMEEENARFDKREELTDDSGFQFKTAPRPHQLKSFLLARSKTFWAHFHPPRTGKTWIVINTAAYLYEQGLIDRVIVIAPNGVHINWIINEIPAHMPDRIRLWTGWYSSHHGKRAMAELVEAANRKRSLKIIAINVDGFSSVKAESLLDHWLSQGKTLMCIDESTRIANPSAKRTKLLIEYGQRAEYRRILTGTPVTSGMENLYSQFKFLDSRILGHESFTTFRSQYCIMGGFEYRQIVGYKETKQLIKIIDGHSDRVKLEDCNLPKKVYQRMPFEMEPKQRKLYDAFRRDSLVEIQAILGEEEGLKRARELAITKFIRLHQIACFLNPSENPVHLEGINPRFTALMEALEESKQDKIIIWARFTADLEMISSKLGDKAVCYWGKVKPDDRIRNMQKFRDRDGIRYFVGHVQAAGIGLNLSAAAGSIYYSNISSLELRLQSEDRPVMEGGPSKYCIDIEAIRSIDRKIINRLRQQKELADEIMQDPASAFLTEE